MCGITGYKSFDSNASVLNECLEKSVDTLNRRGPDYQATFIAPIVGLGHTRLSIIDTSAHAHQPMQDVTGRYTLVFNGEIYNYQELRETIQGVHWKSTSDTEVLLYLLIKKRRECLQDLNGFFAFAFYDQEEDYLLLARDRMGIKPLHYFQNQEYFAFASEMKALLSYPMERKVDHLSLYWYLRLTYLPNQLSMLQGVKKLLPGHYLEIKSQTITTDSYFSLTESKKSEMDYSSAQKKTVDLLEQSVARRMVADVPLGAFLSGGTDSSAVVSLASRFKPDLHTFSIGYRDHAFFDETNFAELVASQFKTNHTTFSLTNEDLLNEVQHVVDYIDEPFADSSAIPTYILSKKVSQSMKVALSGDGADELFGGYYKHLAFNQASKSSLPNLLLKSMSGLISSLPSSRSSTFGNVSRRLIKYTQLLKLDTNGQYWRLASFNMEADNLLHSTIDDSLRKQLYHSLTPKKIQHLNEFLDADLQLVLPGDMLTKVDLMSMANSLEVRVPFLDKDLVAHARSLPTAYKIRGRKRKSVLQDAFEHILPKELHHRPKKGFEVPMLHWLRNELFAEMEQVVFNEDRLQEQGIFNPSNVLALRERLLSPNPGDVHATVWAIYVFQKWHINYLAS